MKNKEKKQDALGPFQFAGEQENTAKNIARIGDFTPKLKKVLKKFKPKQLHRSYRPEGWTALQIVHHLADSHCAAFARMKMAATEPTSPIIKPYNQDDFADLADGQFFPVQASVDILEGLHARWSFFLECLEEEDFEKGYFHPEYGRLVPLKEAIALYAWHGEHHLAQLKLVLTHGVNPFENTSKGNKKKKKSDKSEKKKTIKSEAKSEKPAVDSTVEAQKTSTPPTEDIQPFKVVRITRIEGRPGASSAMPTVVIEENAAPQAAQVSATVKEKTKAEPKSKTAPTPEATVAVKEKAKRGPKPKTAPTSEATVEVKEKAKRGPKPKTTSTSKATIEVKEKAKRGPKPKTTSTPEATVAVKEKAKRGPKPKNTSTPEATVAVKEKAKRGPKPKTAPTPEVPNLQTPKPSNPQPTLQAPTNYAVPKPSGRPIPRSKYGLIELPNPDLLKK